MNMINLFGFFRRLICRRKVRKCGWLLLYFLTCTIVIVYITLVRYVDIVIENSNLHQSSTEQYRKNISNNDRFHMSVEKKNFTKSTQYPKRTLTTKLPVITRTKTLSTKTIKTPEPTPALKDLPPYLKGSPPLHGLPYLISNKELCSNENNLTYFIGVSSATFHFERRQKIRRTWASKKLWNGEIIGKVGFFLGSSSNVTLQRMIEEENNTHGDILQQDFIDSYRNLTFKSIFFLEWVSKYCMNAKYIMKVDDDVMLDMFEFIKIFNTSWKRNTATLMCRVFGRSPVIRGYHGWGVSEHQYKPNHYPPYCGGSVVLFTKDIITPLYLSSFKVPFIPVDDAYITGLLVKDVGKINFSSKRELETLEKYHNSSLARFTMNKNIPLASLPNPDIFLEAWKWIICKQSHLQKHYLSNLYRFLPSSTSECVRKMIL